MKIYICAVAIFLAAATNIGQSIAPPETSKNVSAFYRPVVDGYYSQTDGISLTEIVKRAFDTHGDIIVARLEVDKARARLQIGRAHV